VVGQRVVQIDRRKGEIRDAAGVEAKFGVPPASIPDYLALVGDAADGYPGLPGFGAKSAAAILRAFGHIESIPADASTWRVNVTSAARLSRVLEEQRDLALLFRNLATLRADAPLFDSVETLRWQGPTPSFAKFARSIGAPQLVGRAQRAVGRE
jgi:5'-3' exonuclease